jgi:hypothetical protein
MKTFFTFLIFALFISFTTLTSQVITFSAKDINNNPLQIDSIKIKNLVSGKSITIKKTVIDIETLNLTDIEENTDLSNGKIKLSLNENPDRDIISLLISIPNERNICISVVNLLGIEIAAQKLFLNSGSNNIDLNTPNLSDGIYFIRVNDTKNYASLKFIRNNNSGIVEVKQIVLIKEIVNPLVIEQHEITVYSGSYFPSVNSGIIPENGKNYEFTLIPSDLSKTSGTFSVKNIKADYSHQYSNTSKSDESKSWSDVLNLNFSINVKNEYPSNFYSKITGGHATEFKCFSCDTSSTVSDTIRFCNANNSKYQRCESSVLKFYVNKDSSKIFLFFAQYSDAGLTTGDHGAAWNELQYEIKNLEMKYTVNENGEFIAKVIGDNIAKSNPDIDHHKLYFTSWPISIDPYYEAMIVNTDELKSINKCDGSSVIELILKPY